MTGGEQDGAKNVTAPEVSIHRLPSVGTKIFGRGEDTAWLDACWAEGANIASIIAFGGIGKSTLVWDWLRGMQKEAWRGAERVYGWSFYSQGTTDRATSADAFVSAALRWFGDADPNAGSSWDKGERLAGLIRKQRVILVLDGVEPLQLGPGPQEGSIKDPALATLVRELGAQNAGLCVITSRLAVREAEEFAPVACRRLKLSTLTEEAGAELLRVRGVKGTEEELRAAVREYGGHGLALALLGSYLEEVGEGDVRRRHEIGPLVDDERLGGHARRVIAAYERLFGSGSVEVAILRILGLFDRPADEGEIAALRAHPPIAGLTVALAEVREHRWNKALARLRRLELLAVATGREKWLDAHPLVREYFGEQSRLKWPEAWREGHRRLYEHLKKKAKSLPETIEEMSLLYSAMIHGSLSGRSQEVVDVVYWSRIKRRDEHFSTKKLGAFGGELAALSSLFDPPWERLASGFRLPSQAFILNEAGFVLRALGRLSEAAGLMRLCVEKNIALEDWKEAAVSAASLSELLQSRGELGEALAAARQSVDLAERSDNAFRRIVGLTKIATVLHALGRPDDAAALFREAEGLRTEDDPAFPLLYSVPGFLYCDLLLDQGRDAEVRERASRTLKWSEVRLGLLDIALDHLSLGRAHLFAVQHAAGGDLTQATSHLKDAVEGFRYAGQQDALPLGLLARAALHTHTRAFDLARKDLDEAITLATRCGFRLHHADARLGYSRLALAEGDPAAVGHLATARKIIEQTGYHRRDGELAELDVQARELAKAAPRPTATLAQVPSPPPPAPTPTKPMPDQHTKQHVDVGIVIALPEELRAFLALTESYDPLPDADLDAYLFGRGVYRCAVVLVGEKGQRAAGVFTERLISTLDPAVIVSIGIAGGVHDDLHAGDVHVPEQAVEYMDDSKASPTKDGGFVVVPGAPAFRADFALLKTARSFEFAHRARHEAWVAESAADLPTLLPDAAHREGLVAVKVVRSAAKLLVDGHVATGPVVGAAPGFSAWIRTHDRNVKSIEMESAAVLAAAQNRSQPKRALAIRGISDKGDADKSKMDQLEDGVLRRYAMRNAVRLLWALLDAEALPHHPR